MRDTKIEWCDHTFNPWMGCTRVSPACDHCYAAVSTPARTLGIEWGPHAERRRTSPSTWAQPRKWNREAECAGIRPRVFCASLADVFDNAVDPAWRRDLWSLIGDTPHLNWLLLTKRIGNAADMLPMSHIRDGVWPNVWIGATVVNQSEVDRDVPKLLATPAAKRFLSIEPMLGPIDLTRVRRFAPGVADREWINAIGGKMWTDQTGLPNPDPSWAYPGYPFSEGRGLDWIICGGESGPGARPMHPDWVRSLRDQCAAAGVPFLFKQWGEWLPAEPWYSDHPVSLPLRAWGPEGWSNHHAMLACLPGYMARIGKKAAGRLLDGVQHDGVPA